MCHKKWKEKEHLSRGTDDASSRYLDKQNDAAEYRKRVKEQRILVVSVTKRRLDLTTKTTVLV